MVNTLESETRWRGGVSVYSPTRRIQPRQAGAGAPYQIHAPPGFGTGQGMQMDLGRRIELGSPSQGQTQDQGSEHQGGWRGLLGSVVNNPIGRAVLMPLNILDIPRRLVVSSVKEIGDIFAGGASMSDWWDQVKDPNFGVGSFLHIDGPNNLFNRWTNRLIGLTGDIILDPLTWVGGSSMVTGASRRMRLMMGAEMAGIEGLQDAASTVVRRGVGTLNDATRAAMRQAGIPVRDAGYYFRLPLLMGEHAHIPGTAGLDRLMSSTTGRIIPAVSNTVIGGVLNHWSSDAALQEAAHRMISGRGTLSFQAAAATYINAMEFKLQERSALKLGTSDIQSLIKANGRDTMNAAVRESETSGTGPVAEFFQRARVRNDAAGVRHGVITTKLEDGTTLVTYAPHYRTPEFKALVNGNDPTSVALRDVLNKNGWSSASLDDVSQSVQRRMLKPREAPYDIAGKKLQITDGTIDEFNKGIAALFPDFKGKALYDDFETIATLYNQGMARDIGKVAGVRKLTGTGLVRTGDDADALVKKATKEVIDKHANAAEITRLETLNRTQGKAVANLRKNLSKQYSDITGELGEDLNRVVDQMQTLPPELQGRIKKNLGAVQAEATGTATSAAERGAIGVDPMATYGQLMSREEHAALTRELSQDQLDAIQKRIEQRMLEDEAANAPLKDEVDYLREELARRQRSKAANAANAEPQLFTSIDEAHAHVTAQIDAREAKIDKLAPVAAAEREAMDQVMASGDPAAQAVAMSKGTPNLLKWNDLVKEQMAARTDQAALVELEHRLAVHRAEYNRLQAMRTEQALLDIVESHVGAEANTVRIGTRGERFTKPVPAQPGEYRWHIPAYTDAEGVKVPAKYLRAFAPDAPAGTLGTSWGVRRTVLQQPLMDLANSILDDRSMVKQWAQVVAADGEALSKSEEELFKVATNHSASIDRAKGTLVHRRREERTMERSIENLHGKPAFRQQYEDKIADLSAFRQGSLAEAIGNYERLQSPVSEALARNKAAETRFNQSRKKLIEAASAEDRAVARERYLDQQFSAGASLRADMEATDLVTKTEARIGPKMEAAREVHATRKAALEAETNKLNAARADLEALQQRLDETGTQRSRRQARMRGEEPHPLEGQVERARQEVIKAGDRQREAQRLFSETSDAIADMRAQLLAARQQADAIINPLDTEGYGLQKAVTDARALNGQYDEATRRAEQVRLQADEFSVKRDAARRNAEEITRVFGEIEDTPRTAAARREASRQRRALEAQAAEHDAAYQKLEQQAQLSDQTAHELDARLQQAEAKINRLAGGGVSGGLADRTIGRQGEHAIKAGERGEFVPNIPPQQPIKGGALDKVTGIIKREEISSRVAMTPNKVKVNWEPVPHMPLREGLPFGGDMDMGRIIGQVTGQPGRIEADALRAINASQFESESQRNALTSSPFSGGGKTDLPSRAKFAHANSHDILTDHTSRLMEPGPAGLSAVSADYMATYSAKHAELGRALESYATHPTMSNYHNLEQLTADMNRANAYMAVYSNALSQGVEPSPEVAGLILGEVMEREWRSASETRRQLAERMSPEAFAERDVKWQAKYEKAQNNLSEALHDREQMVSWRDTSDPRFDENKLAALRRRVSTTKNSLAVYVDAAGNPKRPVYDKASDIAELDYLTEVAEEHLKLIDWHEGQISDARSRSNDELLSMTAHEETVKLEASIDSSMRRMSSSVQDNATLLESITAAEAAGLPTVQVPPFQVAEKQELTIAEAQQLLLNGDLSPEIRRKVSVSLQSAQDALARQEREDFKKLSQEGRKEALEEQASRRIEQAEASGDVQYANRLRREAEAASGEAALAEERLSRAERIAANTREVNVYRMTPEGGKGELKRTIGSEEARAAYEAADKTKKVKVTYDVWQPGVEVTELPIADAREMYERNQRFIRKDAAGLESRQLDYDILTGQTKAQEEYIKAILADNRSGIAADVLDNYATMIAEDAKRAGRELTDDELDTIAMTQARAAVRRNSPDGLPPQIRDEMLARFASIRKRSSELEAKFGATGTNAMLTANSMQQEVERILNKDGNLTLDELRFLANQALSGSPEGARMADGMRKALKAIENQRVSGALSTAERNIGMQTGPLVKGQRAVNLLTDDDIAEFRYMFAQFYGDDGGRKFVADILEEQDLASTVQPSVMTEEGMIGDAGVYAAKGRLRDAVVTQGRINRQQARDDLNSTLRSAGLRTYGNKTAKYYRDARGAIRDQLEKRGVRTTRLDSEKLAELNARMSTIEMIMRSLGRPIPGESVIPGADFVDIIARAETNKARQRAIKVPGAAAAGEGDTVGDMLFSLRRKLEERPGEEIRGISRSFRSDLQDQIKAARAAGDTERATTLSKALLDIDQQARVFDRNPPPEEFVPPAVDNASPEALDAPDIPALDANLAAAQQRRAEVEQQLQAATAERDTAAQQPVVPDDPAKVTQEQINTLDARIAELEAFHADQPPVGEAYISQTEKQLNVYKIRRWSLRSQLHPLTDAEQAELDALLERSMGGEALEGRRVIAPATKLEREHLAEIETIVPPNGRHLGTEPGTVPASGAPAEMDDTVRELTSLHEAALKAERNAQAALDTAMAQVDGSTNPSMVDNEAATMAAEGIPAPMVETEAPGPRAITDPDINAVQQEYEIANTEYQHTIARYGSYGAADEAGKMQIGQAAERVRKLDDMRQGMQRDAEEKLMRSDTQVSMQLDQASRRAQQEAIAARNITSDPEYVLMYGTPSQKVMNETAARWKGRAGSDQAKMGSLNAEGRLRPIGGRGVHGVLAPSRPTYYDAARTRLDNLIDPLSAKIRELEDQRDALFAARGIAGDTPEIAARDAELSAEHAALLESAGIDPPERQAALARKAAEENAYTEQLADIEAAPLVEARQAVAEATGPDAASRVGTTLDRAVYETRKEVERVESQALESEAELQMLLNPVAPLPSTAPELPPIPPPPINPDIEMPATNQVAPVRSHGSFDRDLFTGELIEPAAPPAAAVPPAVPPTAGGAPPVAPPSPAAGGAPAPPKVKPRKASAPALPARPGKKASASEWQRVLNELNDINEARRVLGANDETVNQTAALLVAAATSAKELSQAQIDYDLVHKRLADFRSGSQKIAKTSKDIVADGWRQIKWPTLPKDERIVLANELADSLDNFYKAISVPDTWNLLDHYTRFFKTYATGRPGFHVRNTMSSMFMNLVAGVRLHAMWDSSHLWRQFEKDPYTFLSGLNPDSLEYKAFSAVFGSGAAGPFEEIARHYGTSIPAKVWKGVIDNRYTRWNQRFGARVEGSVRLGMALDSMRRGSNVHQAMQRIAKYHFDYTEMTALDRQMRRIIPFWTFLSRNLPLQIEQMWARPRVYLQYRSLVRNFGEAADPLTPQYWLDAGAFTMDPEAGTDVQGSPSSWMVQPDLPFQTAGETINALMEGNIGKGLLSDVNPAILSPMEAFGFNRKLYTGAPLEEGSYHAPNPAQKVLLPLFRLLGATKENALGEEVIDDRYAHVARTLLPPLDLAERFTDTSGTRAGRQDETLMRFLGIPVREVTPEMRQSTRNTAYYDRRDELAQRRHIATAGTR